MPQGFCDALSPGGVSRKRTFEFVYATEGHFFSPVLSIVDGEGEKIVESTSGVCVGEGIPE